MGPLTLIAVGALVLGVAGLLVWRSPLWPLDTATGTPGLKVDKGAVDLGNVPLGQTVSVLFELTNSGDGPLQFREAPYVEVVAGC